MSLTAEPLPITLSGKEYLFTPLTRADLATLDAWVRKRHVTLAAKTSEDLDDKTRDLILQGAMARASTMTWMSGEGAKLMLTQEGMAMLAWVSLQKKHPEVTYEQMLKLMTDDDNIGAVAQSLDQTGERRPFRSRPQQRAKPKKNRSKRKRKGKR